MIPRNKNVRILSIEWEWIDLFSTWNSSLRKRTYGYIHTRASFLIIIWHIARSLERKSRDIGLDDDRHRHFYHHRVVCCCKIPMVYIYKHFVFQHLSSSLVCLLDANISQEEQKKKNQFWLCNICIYLYMRIERA